MSDFDRAKIVLPNGRVGYDAVSLAGIKTEGLFVKDYPRHLIRVRTLNTMYEFVTWEGKITGQAIKPDGSLPPYLPFETEVRINGSTWGGSMLKLGYIGVGMHLEFWDGSKIVTTSTIEFVQAHELANNDPREVYC